jgi:hypothetical protein
VGEGVEGDQDEVGAYGVSPQRGAHRRLSHHGGTGEDVEVWGAGAELVVVLLGPDGDWSAWLMMGCSHGWGSGKWCRLLQASR